MVMELVSGSSLASHLACAHIWSDSGSFLAAGILPATMDSSAKVSGRLAGHIITCRCLLPLLVPPEFSWLVFGGSTVFLTGGTSCSETTHANGSYRAWPGRAVSVNGALTLVPLYTTLPTLMVWFTLS